MRLGGLINPTDLDNQPQGENGVRVMFPGVRAGIWALAGGLCTPTALGGVDMWIQGFPLFPLRNVTVMPRPRWWSPSPIFRCTDGGGPDPGAGPPTNPLVTSKVPSLVTAHIITKAPGDG